MSWTRSMNEPIETFRMEDGNELKIYADDMADDPRKDTDCLGTMACIHRNYRLGDIQPATREEMEALVKDSAVCLPVYLYDHSGLTISTRPFSCPWDSGQIGYIFVSKEKARQEFGKLTKKTLGKITDCLRAEIEMYDQYLTGDVYRFEIARKCSCKDCGDKHEVILDSCGGFYGHDWKENGLFVHAGYKPAQKEAGAP